MSSLWSRRKPSLTIHTNSQYFSVIPSRQLAVTPPTLGYLTNGLTRAPPRRGRQSNMHRRGGNIFSPPMIKYRNAKYRTQVIERQNIEVAKYRIGKYRTPKISKNVVVAKYRKQNIEVAKYRTQNIEVANNRKQNIENKIRSGKISNTKYRRGKISKTKYRSGKITYCLVSGHGCIEVAYATYNSPFK